MYWCIVLVGWIFALFHVFWVLLDILFSCSLINFVSFGLCLDPSPPCWTFKIRIISVLLDTDLYVHVYRTAWHSLMLPLSSLWNVSSSHVISAFGVYLQVLLVDLRNEPAFCGTDLEQRSRKIIARWRVCLNEATAFNCFCCHQILAVMWLEGCWV